MKVMIRDFSDFDLARVLEIERDSFLEPWSRSMFQNIYRQRTSNFIVAQNDIEIIGYIITIIENACGHILNIAVDSKYRRNEIGSILIQTTLKKLREKNVSSIYLEVRRSNNAAVKLYLKFNFTVDRIIRAYYRDNEDALQMSKTLNTNCQ